MTTTTLNIYFSALFIWNWKCLKWTSMSGSTYVKELCNIRKINLFFLSVKSKWRVGLKRIRARRKEIILKVKKMGTRIDFIFQKSYFLHSARELTPFLYRLINIYSSCWISFLLLSSYPSSNFTSIKHSKM